MAAIKKLGVKIDALWKQKMKMDVLSKDIKKIETKKAKLKEKYTEMESALLKEFTKDELMTSAGGKIGKITITRPKVPSVVSWDKLYKYIYRNKAFDMLNRKVNNAAWKERLEHGKKVPGIETVTLLKLNLSAVKK